MRRPFVRPAVTLAALLVLVGPVVLSTLTTGHVSAGPAEPTSFDCSAVTEIPPAECLALVRLYYGTAGSSWANKDGWLATQTPCRWHGITCNAGHVSGLVLPSNQLSGRIPRELGSLAGLQNADLRDNQLTGDLPPQLGSLVSLQSL